MDHPFLYENYDVNLKEDIQISKNKYEIISIKPNQRNQSQYRLDSNPTENLQQI